MISPQYYERNKMNSSNDGRGTNTKREAILKAAFKLFTEIGYEKTSVRHIVEEARTSMGNLYFHFPNKLSILEYICAEFVDELRNQIHKIHDLELSPEVGFALDFRLGYLATLEDAKFSQIFSIARNRPEIHKHSLENKKIRLTRFFGDRIAAEDLDFMSIAIQGIADAIFEQKRSGRLKVSSDQLSNTIIDYSLRLLGYSTSRISEVIREVNVYIEENQITSAHFFSFPEY